MTTQPTVSERSRASARTWLIVAGALALLLAALYVATEFDSWLGLAPARPTEAPVTLQGTEMGNSRTFHLNGGTYSVTWQARPNEGPQCFHALDLTTEGTTDSRVLVSQGTVSRPLSGKSTMQVQPGDYRIDSYSGCVWSVTFAPN